MVHRIHKVTFKLLRICIILGACYVLFCGALYFNQERLIFHPEVLPPGFRFSFTEPFSEIALPVDGAALSAVHFRCERPRGVVLYLHGNTGNIQNWATEASTFLTRGYDAFFFDYRGFGKSTGKLTREASLLTDARAAYRYLRERYGDDRIVVYGRSLGTGPAAYLAATFAPRALVLEAPYYSMQDMARREYPFVPGFILKYPLRTDRWVSSVRCPVYLFHGTADTVIPHSSSIRLENIIGGRGHLVILEGGQHDGLGNYTRYHEVLNRILE